MATSAESLQPGPAEKAPGVRLAKQRTPAGAPPRQLLVGHACWRLNAWQKRQATSLHLPANADTHLPKIQTQGTRYADVTHAA